MGGDLVMTLTVFAMTHFVTLTVCQDWKSAAF